MHFYEQLGFLVFGSRLKRLSESFLADVNKVYASHNIEFDSSWFPIFYILSQNEEVSIRDISDQLSVSHSAVSQLVSNLQQRELIKTTASVKDGRKKVIAFTDKGQLLQKQIEPIWNALSLAMQTLTAENKHSKHILKAITEMEASFKKQPLFERMEKLIKP